jgi:protein-tyrosine phosphatase
MNLDYLPADVTGLGARLGLMSAPGPRSDVADNLTSLRDTHRCALLVSLTGEYELELLGISDLVARCAALGLAIIRFPIGNFSTPDTPDELVPLVTSVLDTARGGGTVFIHCWAGLGRSGMVAACSLAAGGIAPDDAIVTVRRYRRGAIETPEQEAYVHRFARRWHASPR